MCLVITEYMLLEMSFLSPQYFVLSPGAEIRRDDICLDYGSKKDIRMHLCNGNKGHQEWIYRDVSTGQNILM